jgi:hypothetical protein
VKAASEHIDPHSSRKPDFHDPTLVPFGDAHLMQAHQKSSVAGGSEADVA